MNRAVAGLVLAAAIGGGLLGHEIALGRCTQDDSFITFRYAENLAEGRGLVFNPGWDRVEGYTNFLWTVILAGFIGAGFDPVPVSRVLGVLCGFAVLLLTWRLAVRVCGRGWREGLTGLAWFAAWSAFAGEAVQGLETLLFTLLVLGGTFCFLAGLKGSRPDRALSAILYGFAAMTRPEGVMVAGLGFCFLLIHSRMRGGPDGGRAWGQAAGRAIAWGSLFLGVFGPYFLWRWLYYGGYPFPNTFYAKTGGGLPQVIRGVDYTLDFALAVLPLLLLAAAYLARTDRKDARWAAFPGLLIFVYALYVASVGGDFKSTFRFFIPVFPFLVLLAQEGLLLRTAGGRLTVPGALAPVGIALLTLRNAFTWSENLPRKSDLFFTCLPVLVLAAGLVLAGALARRPRVAVPPLLAGAGVLLFLWWRGDVPDTVRLLVPSYPFLFLGLHEGLLLLGRRVSSATVRAAVLLAVTAGACTHLYGFSLGSRMYARALRESLVDKKAIANYLTRVTDGSDVLAIGTVGIVPYYTRLPTIDMWGLNDLHIAHRKSPWSGRGSAGHEKGDGRYIFDRRPTVIVFRLLSRTAYPVPVEDLAGLWPDLFLSEQELLRIPEFLGRYELRSEYLVGFYFNYFRLRDEFRG